MACRHIPASMRCVRTQADRRVGQEEAVDHVLRDGSTVRKADLLGKVWVASFVFTRCTGPCPQVTATMARLQSDLPADDTVRRSRRT